MKRRGERRAALATGLIVVVLVATGVASEVVAPADVTTTAAPGEDVMQWFDDIDPRLIIDRSCMRSKEPVAYRKDQLMVRASSTASVVAQVDTRLQQADMSGPAPDGTWILTKKAIVPPAVLAGPPIVKTIVITFKPRPSGVHPIVKLARALRDNTASPLQASPNYAYAPSPYVSFWPFGYAEPAAKLHAARTLTTPTGQPVGTGVTIAVYDSGRAPGDDPRLANASTFSAAIDSENPDVNLDGLADGPAAGHGKAVAGAIATMAPGAIIKLGRITDKKGVATDATSATRIVNTLKPLPLAEWPDLILSAFGSPACDRKKGQLTSDVTPLQPLAMEMVAEIVHRFAPHRPNGMLQVASAGNRKSNRPWYPAGFNLDPMLAPTILSVGALDGSLATDGVASEWFSRSRTGPMAPFSNHGDWVEAWGPGVHLATTHLVNVAFDDDTEQPAVLQGKAYVDGTSFAAPVVAAMVAERMSVVNGTTLAAWEAIRNTGAAPLPPCDGTNPSLGDGVAVILAGMNAPATKLGNGVYPTC